MGPLPPEIEDFETFVIGYSGGKDSTATVLWALDNLPRKHIQIVNNPTGAHWPGHYRYLASIEQTLDIEIKFVKAGDYPLPPKTDGSDWAAWYTAPTLYQMIRSHGRWPSYWQRWCTRYLKQWPLRLYAAECRNPVLIMGERREESKSRAQLTQFDPNDSTFNDRIEFKIPNYRPVLDWSMRQVFSFLHEHNVSLHPAYRYATRVGCWCCPLGSPDTVMNFCRLYPRQAQRWANLEREIRHTWQHRQSINNLLRRTELQIPLFDFQSLRE